jgi:hypothetical protein
MLDRLLTDSAGEDHGQQAEEYEHQGDKPEVFTYTFQLKQESVHKDSPC